MRGQRLFIRPLDPRDHDAIRHFLDLHLHPAPVPAAGIVGKLVGDLVAVAAMELTGDAIRLDDLFVAPDLRRKRVGRFMVDELASLAAKMDREWVVVEQPCGAQEFLRKTGFVERGERWERRVR